MARIKKWKLFRAIETREKKIAEQEKRITTLIVKCKVEKKKDILRLEEQLEIKRRELKELTNQ